MQKIGVIADDLTGATDVAAAFSDAGFNAVVAFSLADLVAGVDARVLAVSTDSRHLSPAVARQRVRRAWQALKEAGCQLFYKKMDSTVKGNIVAEVEALRRCGGYAKALVCPANPGQGRCIRAGVLTVRGEFLADLRPHFSKQGLDEAAFLHQPITRPRLAAALNDRAVSTVVADAASDRELRTLVRGALQSRALLAGSAGMAGQLARLLRPRPTRPARPLTPKTAGATLILCGTRSSVTAAQVKCLEQRSGATILNLADASVEYIQPRLTRGATIVLHVPIYRQTDATILRQLRRLSALCHLPVPPLLLVTGGDTTRLVCRWLRPRALEMRGELLPGLAWGQIVGGVADSLSLCTKPGGFGDEDSLVRAVKRVA